MHTQRTGSSLIEGRAILPNIEPGWQHLGDMEKKCPKCGAIYYKRICITPNNLVDTFRSKCLCDQSPEHQQRDRLEKARRLQAKVTRLFGAWDLLADPACKHMVIEKFKPDTESQRRALAVAMEFRPGIGNLCFYGRGGRGKTHIAVSMARKARQKGYCVLAIKSIDLLGRLRRCYQSKESNDEVEIMQLLKNLDLLVIDDIGIEKSNDWVKAKFHEIIDYRYNRRSTLFTTNLAGEDMENRLGQGIVSRVWSRSIEMLGEDLRINDWSDVGREID